MQLFACRVTEKVFSALLWEGRDVFFRFFYEKNKLLAACRQ